MYRDILEIQKRMKQDKISAYLLLSSDQHNSEYVDDHYKTRNFLSGFEGSNGTMLITQDSSYLWTDGRYFLQAERELEKSKTKLMKMGVEGYPNIIEFIMKNLSQSDVLGFDGKCVPASLISKLEDIALNSEIDYVSEFWKDRPNRRETEIFKLTIEQSGRELSSKLEELRDRISKKGADSHVISALDDIAYLLNLRANDIEHTPVFFSFMVVDKNRASLFVKSSQLNQEVRNYLVENKIDIYEYDEFYDFIENNELGKVLVDLEKINFKTKFILSKKSELIVDVNPVQLMKCVKNEVEVQNMRIAHIKDGLAMTRFMIYLKDNHSNALTEISLEEKALEFRKLDVDYLDLSFSTISAYGANGANMHYTASRENEVEVKKGSLYLIDSGAHYRQGSTDITRTFAIGEIDHQMKVDYTRVLKSVIGLSTAVFLHGCMGTSLDVLSRIQLWKHGIDYRSGTGHGIGYLLGVHEGPNGFRWQIVPERRDNVVLEEGMITTVEPGVYRDHQYGIRLENMLVCRKHIKNEYGQFMNFENICMCPFDLDAILPELLNEEEKKYLNDYHREVYQKISPFLNDEEKSKLKHYTRGI